MNPDVNSSSESFDQYAADYDKHLNEGLKATGEDKFYYAEKRIEWIKHLLPANTQTQAIMDFGCGTGTSINYLFDLLQAKRVVGVDVSEDSLIQARRINKSRTAEFLSLEKYKPREEFDLVFTNGVFHHIPPKERPQSLRYIYAALKKNGLFCYWENNPWNPGTKYVMSKIPFDRDAQTLSPFESERLLRDHQFKILNTTYRFLFPKILSFLRPLEKPLCRFPLLAQYLVLCQK